ncbi:MAG: ABC transporter permease [Oscillospiraceae bacterium]|nr:ABC transporter permease [Oscillospiraceae bacterium]
MRGNFENTGKLVRFMLKREIVTSTVWIVILALFSAALAPAMSGMFDTDGRAQFVATLDNPVMVAMMGPVYGADNYTEGAMYTGMMLLWVVIAAAVMNIFLVVRHTRADEEKGRAEVVRSLPVGRLANLNAAMLTALIINAVLGLSTGLGLAAMGVANMGFAGSMLFGAAVGAGGLAFAAVTALFCQLSTSRSGAAGFSFLALGVFYMLRAAGDMQNSEILSCISPLGLVLRAQAYIENRWWPIFVLLTISAAISAAAYRLNSIRDLDQGFIPARPGKKQASVFLRSNFGLSFRLLRNTVIVWVIVMFSLGASYGSIIGDIGTFVGDSPEYLQILGMPKELVDTLTGAEKESIVQTYFMSFVTSMMTLIAIVPLLLAAMKPRSEEKDHRAEHVLSRVVPRGRYLAAYTAIAYLSSALIPCATAAGIYAPTGAASPFSLADLFKANLAYLPALWVMIGIAVFLVGALPKFSGAIWGYYGFVCFSSFIGEVIGLPDWLLGIAPLKHVSKVLLVDIDYVPLIVMTAIAIALTAAGFVFYRKREMVTA